MFEDNNNQNQPSGQAPQINLADTGQMPVSPKPGRDLPGTEDIFADSEKNLAMESQPVTMPPLKKTSAVSFQNPPVSMGPPNPLSSLPDDLEEEGGKSHKFLWIGIIFFIIILGLAGYWAYAKFFANSGLNLPSVNINSLSPDELNKQFQNDITNLNLNANQENANINSSSTPIVNATGTAVDFLDTDHDGLSDAQESSLGTDTNTPDSDADGLSDREEVNVYHTNPLNPDSDGDGYTDGREVQNGYSPSGPGKLLEFNPNSTSTSAQ